MAEQEKPAEKKQTSERIPAEFSKVIDVRAPDGMLKQQVKVEINRWKMNGLQGRNVTISRQKLGQSPKSTRVDIPVDVFAEKVLPAINEALSSLKKE
jgi:tRNA 2-selenouridine synthase SelU